MVKAAEAKRSLKERSSVKSERVLRNSKDSVSVSYSLFNPSCWGLFHFSENTIAILCGQTVATIDIPADQAPFANVKEVNVDDFDCLIDVDED